MTSDLDVNARAPSQTAETLSAGGKTVTGSLPERIGSYRILRSLGEGGMGIVYEAEQDRPRRRVALKVVRPGHLSAQAQKRFEFESHVLGRLHHPGIAQIFDAGTADAGYGPQPYFAMEYVEGKPLMTFAQEQRLSVRMRLALLAKIADAVHHAHQKGVIHRDLKPGNLLVTADGQPKILDFGVARATDSDLQITTVQTDVGQLVGTVRYMSPEQVSADPNELDTRSDVYALGVVLYELLTGRLPYDLDNKMVHEAVRVIRESDAMPLSTINRVFRGDVDTIVSKALEKDKLRRYQSAADLSEDIRRYLGDEPIVARPPSAMYQLTKFAKRNRALVGGVAAVFVALLIGLGVSLTLYVYARGQARIAGEQRALAQTNAERAEAAAAEARREAATAERARQAEAEQRQLAESNAEKARQSEEVARSEQKRSAAVVEFLTEMLKAAQPMVALGRDTTLLREMADQTARKIAAGGLRSDPRVEAAISSTLGFLYFTLGQHERADPLLTSALSSRRREFGEAHVETAGALHDLGMLRTGQGRAAEAEAAFRQALAVYRGAAPDGDLNVAATLNNLGRVISQQGRLAEAEALHREALEIQRRLGGSELDSIAESLSYLGMNLHDQGRLNDAAPLLKESVELHQKRLGPESPATAAAMNNYSQVLNSLGRMKDAEPILRSAVAAIRKTLGEDHPIVATSYSNLGRTLQLLGKFDESEECHRKALAINRKALGEEHPALATTLNNLGLVLKHAGKLKEAEAVYQEALEIRRKVLPPEHPDMAQALNNLASLMREQKRPADAEPLYREAAAIMRRALGDEHPHLALALTGLARVMLDQSKAGEAEPHFREALAILEKSMPPGHSFLAQAHFGLGSCLADQGRFHDAEPLLTTGYEELTASPGIPADILARSAGRVEQFYTDWEASEPGQGHAAKAASWRGRAATSRPAE